MRESQRIELELAPALGRLLVVWGDHFRLLAKCSRCRKWVRPEKILIGPHHIRMTHCGISQEVAVTA